MRNKLKGRDFISLIDYTPEELRYLIQRAIEMKRKLKLGELYQPLAGKTLGMIFEKTSTRTRVSFEVGMYQLGGHALFLSSMICSSAAARRSPIRRRLFPAIWMALCFALCP